MKFRSSFAFVLALALLAGCFMMPEGVIAAGRFSDVADNYWGRDFIESAADSGIISGYPQGSGFVFKPEVNVSKQESLVMLYNTLSEGDALYENGDLSEEMSGALENTGAASWAKPFAAYMLKYSIAEEGDFAKKTAGGPARRDLVASWAAKAMDYDISPLMCLPYSDAAKLSDSAWPYVDSLRRHGIMMGNADGTFSADAGIKRVELAVVCSKLLDEIYNPKPMSEACNVISTAGYIENIGSDGLSFTIKKLDGSSQSFRLAAWCELYIDAQSAGANQIKKLSGSYITIGCISGTDGKVLIQTRTMSQRGKISAVVKCGDFSLVTIECAGEEYSYCMDSSYTGKSLSAGMSVDYICDGVRLVEAY